MACVVYLAARKDGQQLRAREDHDARPNESFRELIHRVLEVPVGAELSVRIFPNARELALQCVKIKISTQWSHRVQLTIHF